MDDLTELLISLSIVPICVGLIFGFVGTPMAIAHGDWMFAVGCVSIGVLSIVCLYASAKYMRARR